MKKEKSAKNLKEIKFAFAVITKDKYGETIQIFKTKKQAEEFYQAILKPIK